MPLARIVLAILALLISTVTFAQPAGNARLLVTVVDVTGAILPGASVTVVPEGPSAGLPATVAANDSGVATIAGLAPGRYTIRAEFSGFDAG
ncbi:MAG TPA: carboxypeptidase-like regulatory domain-containing protein, partial [Vicinamibacterales bacterium]